MDKLYSTNRQIVWMICWGLSTLLFIFIGITMSLETFYRMTWPSIDGIVISCVQYDTTVQRHRSPGQQLYFERVTHENLAYEFTVLGHRYLGESKESLKAGDNWRSGSRRVLISSASETPITIWYNPRNPNQNSIKKYNFLDLPLWPWLVALISIGGFFYQLQDRKDSLRINNNFPAALKKAQLNAFKQKIGHFSKPRSGARRLRGPLK